MESALTEYFHLGFMKVISSFFLSLRGKGQ